MVRKSETLRIPLDIVGEFPSHWMPSTLNDACNLVTDGTHDSPKPVDTGFPLITGKCITQGKVDFDCAYLISLEEHKKVIARSRPEKGDIIFANIGNSIGDLALIDTEREFSIKNVALFKPSKKLDSHFLKYYLLSPSVQNYIKNTSFGSAQPFISLATLRAFPVPLAPLPEQQAIAHILGTLDDKIELNQQMNRNLEAIASAIFKSWFVDFDPVRTKMEGREPAGMDADTAALFPDSFEDSLLGEIPKGWEVLPIIDLCSTFTDGSHYSPKGQEAGHYIATVKDMGEFDFLWKQLKRISDRDGVGA